MVFTTVFFIVQHSSYNRQFNDVIQCITADERVHFHVFNNCLCWSVSRCDVVSSVFASQLDENLG